MNKYTKWDLIRRWEVDSTIFLIVISIMFVISLIFVEELRVHEVYFAFSCLIWFMTLIQCVRFVLHYNKISRIVSNQKILNTKVTWVSPPGYWSNLNCKLKSTYFDKNTDKIYLFDFSGSIKQKLNKNQNFKQGESIYDLKTIDVLVNEKNYNEYVVLFEEELNLAKR